MFECFKKKKPELKHLPPAVKNHYPEHYLKLALGITGAFEGSGYDNIAGNFDGQGISAGILQWNYGQGSLQSKILMPLIAQFGEKMLDDIFPNKVACTASMTPKEAIKYAKKHMLVGKNLKPDWAIAWSKFLSSPEAIKQQLRAADSIASKAWGYCERYQMRSPRHFCWFFDIVTQNGSLKGIERPDNANGYEDYLEKDGGKNKDAWMSGRYDFDARLLFVWTCKRVTRNKWASDVIARKGTIAHGYGWVHGKLYKLEDLYNQSM